MNSNLMKIFEKYFEWGNLGMEKYEKLLNMLMDFNVCIRFAAVCNKNGKFYGMLNVLVLKTWYPW